MSKNLSFGGSIVFRHFITVCFNTSSGSPAKGSEFFSVGSAPSHEDLVRAKS